ncbi:MAG: bifunctional diaminohydroxyphosphoribosylaminopyrimidine deaminase/5-amino-6-(5-phosphoribosylamino)uracil reductase RibD [Calditrichae bacterium]|nr:bifunctional diaminohydroxyphosphoribosylaminopyrimidine deaminase/5-amino-6-(5-phosphoribosylamino)uracil reductase RibD [Calditrichia bacterium]
MKTDAYYMRRCLKLALKGAGYVSPNPMVGAVIVKNNRVIAEGWHAAFGGLHAEAMAFQNAREDVTGATLYCNLEPCFHSNKKTPPCVPLVIDSGIKRVVLSNTDPNPFVSGKSINLMRTKGIEVAENVLEEQGAELNRFFFKHIKTSAPWITLKIAQTLDGYIAPDKNSQSWITGDEAGKKVHSLRSQYDAVLVGAGTVRVDDPQLNVRHIKGRQPLKIIISSRLQINPGARAFDAHSKTDTWIFHSRDVNPEAKNIFDKPNIKLVECPPVKATRVDLKFVMNYLGKAGISSVLVEGGQEIFSDFIEQSMFDEIIILQSAQFWGAGLKNVNMQKRTNLHVKEVSILGTDCYINLRKKD